MPAFGNGPAVFAKTAGMNRRAAAAVFAGAVERFGYNPGGGSFADPADAGQNIGMMQAVVFDGVG